MRPGSFALALLALPCASIAQDAAGAGEAVVHGESLPRSAGDLPVRIGGLGALPRLDASELLTLVPGVSLSNEGGAGDAPEISLRGFRGDNGQDVAVSVDGVPLNEDANPLTHGNADTLFIPPELVQQLLVVEGLGDPQQGNFALAGSVDYRLGLAMPGTMLRATAGSFGYARLAAFTRPVHGSERDFTGAEVVRADGVVPQRGYARATALAQRVFHVGPAWELRVFAAAHAGRWGNPGVVRQDDVDAGRIGAFAVYPGTGSQGGSSARAIAAATLSRSTARGRFELRMYAQYRQFRDVLNDDGFVDSASHGDLTSSTYVGATLGLAVSYRHARVVGGLVQELAGGLALRHDRYATGVTHLDAVTNAAWSPPSPDDDATPVRVTDASAWIEATARLTRWLGVIAGARAELFAYGAPYGGDAVVLGRALPKVSLLLGPWAGVRVVASYGEGLRNPDARALAAGAPPVFASARTADLSLRIASPARWRARVAGGVSAFHTDVAHEAVFDPVAATTVDVGDTSRFGAMAWARAQPLPWIDASAWVSYTRSALGADALGGALHAGDAVPYLPSLVARADVVAEGRVATVRGRSLHLRGGLAANYRGVAALPSNGSTDPVWLVDATAGARWGVFGLDLAVRNVLDTPWHSADFVYASRFDPAAASVGSPARHFVAGAPRTFMATLTLAL